MIDSPENHDPGPDGVPASPDASPDGVSASSDGSGCEFVAGGSQWHPMKAAAIVGGAIAAGAGAYLGRRALQRRSSTDGRKLNAVMETAITATDVAPPRGPARLPRTPAEPRVAHEPVIPSEPRF